jgi:4-amino-4-deoxy-L-arabinose transferase-like glycosyltransferase
MEFFTDTFRNKYLPLLGLILFFLVVRLLILFSGVGNLIFDQETNIGTVAKMLIDGTSPGFIFDCFDNYRWGAMVAGILTVPFFLLFGENLAALRAVAMFFSFGTLILLYLFLHDFFSRKAAILAAIFFILAPPNYVKSSFTASGGYCEINFFSMLAILLFYKIFFAGGTARKHLYAFFGFVCGFALLYDYTFLLTLSCCLIFWFIFDKGILVRKNFYVFFLFFLIGFSPWFYYNATHGWKGIFVMKEQSLLSWFSKNGFLGSLIQLKDLVTFIIPGFFYFKDFLFLSKSFISYIYYLIFVISFVGLFWLQRKSIIRFFWSLIPLRRFSVSPAVTSRETPLIIYLIIFGLAYSFCGISYLPPVEADLVFPHRFVVFIVPYLFMIASIFLIQINSNKYGSVVSRILTRVLIIISLISNIGMISLQSYMISVLPEGYNYISFGKELRYQRGDDIEQPSDFIKKIDKKHRRFFYDGYRWAVPKGYDGYKWAIPEGERVFSVEDYVQKKIVGGIDKDYWPFAYEHLGRAMGHYPIYSKSADEELKRHLEKAFHPYFYLGLGRSCVDKEFSERKYNYILGIIDKQYWRYFHEGMGIEMDVIFVDNFEKFNQFMSTIDTGAKVDIYRGFAEGKEYPRISYRKFQPGFGKIIQSMKEWERLISNIEEEFKPYCYQRLGVEVGWRLIYGMKGYLDFLRKTGDGYKPYMYKGVGVAVGWRFGYNIKGCVRLINKLEPEYRDYLYEGLGAGVVKRYGYPLDERTRELEIEKIPVQYRRQFRKGLRA